MEQRLAFPCLNKQLVHLSPRWLGGRASGVSLEGERGKRKVDEGIGLFCDTVDV